jgi:hypothetical protein
LSRKDFLMRIRISRTESKETRSWLRLLATRNESDWEKQRIALVSAAGPRRKMFGAIPQNSE